MIILVFVAKQNLLKRERTNLFIRPPPARDRLQYRCAEGAGTQASGNSEQPNDEPAAHIQ